MFVRGRRMTQINQFLRNFKWKLTDFESFEKLARLTVAYRIKSINKFGTNILYSGFSVKTHIQNQLSTNVTGIKKDYNFFSLNSFY